MKENEQSDLVRLRHMLDAAHKAMQFADGKTRSSLDNDDMLLFAVVRALEIIGEVASRMTKNFRDANPQIPWPVMIGMRNRIIHVYFDVELDIVWDTVAKDLPALIAELQKLIPPDGEGA